MLVRRADKQPDAAAFTFLRDGEDDEELLTYADLDRRARSMAVRLQAAGVTVGDRVLMLLPPGVEYLATFYGCLYAGAIAVPAYPPRAYRRSPELEAITVDSGAAAVVVTESVRNRAQNSLSEVVGLSQLQWVSADAPGEDRADEWQPPPIGPENLALLQYTSGSTGAPKGVMVGHGNMLANSWMVASKLNWEADTRLLLWLPPYHDMGLVAGIVTPVRKGLHCVLMKPVHFVKRPARWIRALTKHQATATGGPNFSYELLVDRVPPEEREAADLSSLVCAFNGAEPVRAGTLRRFAEAYAPQGFREEAFYPAYGLAEATLMVSGGEIETAPTTKHINQEGLAQGRFVPAEPGDEDAREVVACGTSFAEHGFAVVDPQTRMSCPEGVSGEVWVRGPSITHGYWQRPRETSDTFGARLATGEGPFLRTGDMGVIDGGELYITGRFKELIIIRGRNYAPSDIEATVVGASSELAAAVAFSIDTGGDEQLVVVAEVPGRDGHDLDQIALRIRQAVADEHGLQVHSIALVGIKRLPTTTSGKLQRSSVRTSFLAGALDALGVWEASAGGPDDERAVEGLRAAQLAQDSAKLAEALEDWLVSAFSKRLSIDADDVELDRPLADYGLDSMEGVRIAGDLSVWLGRALPSTLVWEYPTISALAGHLAGGNGNGGGAA